MINETISIELYEENGKQMVFISHGSSSGCSYEVKNVSEVGRLVKDYIKNYL